MREVILRSEAIRQGLPTYFTGKPCKRGHIDVRSTKHKICAACNREKVRIYVANNPERKKALDAEYAARNKERVADNKRRYYLRNRELVKARVKEWSQDNKEQAQENWNAATRAYRARKRAAIGSHTAAEIRELRSLQRNKCACCGEKLATYHVDHIVPLSKGGSNDRANLQLLCAPCNTSKAAKHPIAFMQERGFLL